MNRINNIDWLPINLANRDLTMGSKQIVLLYKKAEINQCYLEYSTSNPDYAIKNAEKDGYTEFALLVDSRSTTVMLAAHNG